MNLYLPASRQAVESEGSLSVRNAKRWVESLPLVNMSETTRLFYQELQAFNRTEVAPRQRFDTMARLLPTSRLVASHLLKHFASCAFPLARKGKQVKRLATAFFQEMSVAYKLIINEVATDNTRIDKQVLAACCHHALNELYQIMLLYARTYTNTPGKIWHDMHQIYEFADKRGVSRVNVASIGDDKHQTTTLEIYLKCCLLGLCEPQGLRGGEALKLDALLNDLVKKCNVSKSLNADEKGVLHVIGLRSSGPPSHVNLADLTTFSNLRGLELGDMLRYLERAVVDNPEELAPMDEHSIRRLIDVWSQKAKRKFSRVDADERLIAAIGLKDILHAVNSDRFPTMDGEEIIQHLIEEESAQTTPGVSLTTTQFNLKPKNDTWYKTTITDPRYPDSWHYWRLINTSAGGYGLLWESETLSRAQVGDVIALREKENKRFQWRMGRIVWMRHNPKEQLVIGVKMLAPRTVIATVKEIESKKTRIDTPFDIIMLPGLKTFRQPPCILADKDIFQLGDRLIVTMLGKQLTVQLKSIGENQSFYTQYYYQSSEVKEKSDEKTEFAALWDKH